MNKENTPALCFPALGELIAELTSRLETRGLMAPKLHLARFKNACPTEILDELYDLTRKFSEPSNDKPETKKLINSVVVEIAKIWAYKFWTHDKIDSSHGHDDAHHIRDRAELAGELRTVMLDLLNQALVQANVAESV